MNFEFENKVVLLTGAAGGIGKEIARTFHESGALLVLADIDSSAVEDFARTLSPSLDGVLVAEVDSGDVDSVNRLVDAAVEKFGHLDVVIPSAGIYPEVLLENMTDAQWRKVMSINLDGVFYLLRASIPHLRDGGSIVNIASVAGHKGSHSHSHYAVSKAGVISLTRSLALELGARNIRANAVSPGIIETPMIKDFLVQRGDAAVETTPLHRLGQPGEVAAVVAFLASDAASFVNGEVIHVNGGMYLA